MLFTFWRRKVGSLEWDQITEEELHSDLYRNNRQTTPLIAAMLHGNKTMSMGYEYKLEMDIKMIKENFCDA